MIYDEMTFTATLTPLNTSPTPYENTVSVNNDITTLIDVIAFSTDVEGTIDIVINQTGTLVDTSIINGYDVDFYRKSSGVLTAYNSSLSTAQEVTIDTYYTDIIGIEAISANKLAVVYTKDNTVKITEIVVNTMISIQDTKTITSNGGGTLSSIQYEVDSNGTIHFVYFDSMGQSSLYEKPDLMYYNTWSEVNEVLHYGFRDHLGGSDYVNSYVNEVVPVMTIDNNDNVVVMYVVHDWSSWIGGQDHNYSLRLQNTQTKVIENLEGYYNTSASLRFGNLELTGGSYVTARYMYSSTPYERLFDGLTLTEQ